MPDLDLDRMIAICETRRSADDLTHMEKVRCFRWFRQRAFDAILMAKQLRGHGLSAEIEKERILLNLGAAREIFPLTRDGETVSVESILQGQEPYDSDGG